MAISKIVYKESPEATPEVWMDVTQKTVTSASMLNGVTALKNDGTDITGNIASKTSSDLTVSGATVTAPAGMYSSSASKSVASGSATTPATTVTANPSISVNSSGLITATASATKSVTPTVSAGYVSSGSAGTITVSGSNTEQLSTQAAQTLYPSTTDQTISSGKYLTGAQTIKGVLLTNLSAGNIKKDVVVKVGDSADDDRITSVTGTYEGSGGGGGGGGGGLEYEAGTLTPAENVDHPTISFSNQHSSPPFYALVENIEGYTYTLHTNQAWIYTKWDDVSGVPIYAHTTAPTYGVVWYRYRNTSETSHTNSLSLLNVLSNPDSSNCSEYYVSSSALKPYSLTSVYFGAGMTYKWIAVWGPTT